MVYQLLFRHTHQLVMRIGVILQLEDCFNKVCLCHISKLKRARGQIKRVRHCQDSPLPTHPRPLFNQRLLASATAGTTTKSRRRRGQRTLSCVLSPKTSNNYFSVSYSLFLKVTQALSSRPTVIPRIQQWSRTWSQNSQLPHRIFL